jgi:heme exporter protein A
MLIEAQSMSCERSGRKVITDLSFCLEAGGCMELRGPNGSGKSTLLRVLAGFLEIASGKIRRESTPIYIGHSDAVKAALTVRENLAFWHACFGGDIDIAIAAFGLEPLADDPAAILSQGQKRRLALARLALLDRPIWLLDEPTVGLDDASRHKLMLLMQAQRERGGCIVAATHEDIGLKGVQRLELGRQT